MAISLFMDASSLSRSISMVCVNFCPALLYWILSIKMINVTLPGMKISRNKIEEKTINLRRMEVWRFWDTGIEKMLLYFIVYENYTKPGATKVRQIEGC
jgi:hypothetical protein